MGKDERERMKDGKKKKRNMNNNKENIILV